MWHMADAAAVSVLLSGTKTTCRLITKAFLSDSVVLSTRVRACKPYDKPANCMSARHGHANDLVLSTTDTVHNDGAIRVPGR